MKSALDFLPIIHDTMKHAIKNWLKSQVVRVRCVATHTIHPDYVGAGATVLDLGANHGAFSEAMISEYEAACYMVEANPKLAGELRHSKSEVVCAAVVGRPRVLEFVVREQDDSSSLSSFSTSTDGGSVIKVDGIDYAEVLQRFSVAQVDLLKMDIEGAEIEVIDTMTDSQLQAIGQITIEFHDQMSFYSVDETKRVLARLERLGFLDHRLYRGSTLDVLLINKNRCPGAVLEWLRVVLVTRPLIGLFWSLRTTFEKNGLT